MASSSVIVVGSLSVDFVMRVPRRPQKGETIAGYDFNTFVGGKGNNQALAAARAGAKVRFVGRIGTDEYGNMIAQTLTESGVDTRYLYRDPQAGTGIANIYVDPQGDNSIVIVPRSNGKLSSDDVIHARELFEDERAKVLLLQMEVPDAVLLTAAKLANALGIFVILNPAPAPPSGKLPDGLLQYVDLVVPNQTEAELLTNVPVNDCNSALKAAQTLMKEGARNVIVTMGEQGAFVCNAAGETHAVPTFPIECVDTTAAGDAFCGALAAGLANEMKLLTAVKLGCAAGALACTKAGAEPSLPWLAEINQLMAGAVS